MLICLQLSKGAFEAALKNSVHHIARDYKIVLIGNPVSLHFKLQTIMTPCKIIPEEEH